MKKIIWIHLRIDISKLKLDVKSFDFQTLESEHLLLRTILKNNWRICQIIEEKFELEDTLLFCCENTGDIPTI
jgi:hypothetical protein